MKTLSIFRKSGISAQPLARIVSVSAVTLFGSAALALALDPPPGGAYPIENTALGQDALLNMNTTFLGQNTALGFDALYSNTTGQENTAVGDEALYSNTVGGANVAVGYDALYHNTNGVSNVAIGSQAMVSNTTALEGTAVGAGALLSNTTGGGNTAIGFDAMTYSTGAYNTAVGGGAMAFNGAGIKNVALGGGAMSMSGAGSNNVAIGYAAGYSLTGTNNIVIGYNAANNLTAATSSNNIEIGTLGTNRDANVIRLGDPAVQKKTFVAGISRATVADGTPVVVDNKGQLGVATSSARFKREIKPMSKASEAILSLQPVTFRYKEELDSSGVPQFGLVAEEVAKVDPDLVAKDDEGKPYTVRYEAVNAMLLNEFLKEHKTVEAQAKEITELKSALKQQSEQMQDFAARLKANGL